VRRADRLFQIVQKLRRKRGVLKARELAESLEVSERTIYRDVADLISSGVPIQGEAGVGYALPKGFDLPPLMFTAEEIEALVLGARIVQAWSDPQLAKAAEEVLDKIDDVLPPRLRDAIPDAALFAPNFHVREQLTSGLAPLRAAIRDRKKVTFDYQDGARSPSTRTVQPLGVFFWGASWSLGAWCELRRDFRNFRLDRISGLRVLAEKFPVQAGRTLSDFFARYDDEER
jgi:predicted DNA-binding transcriptional regulator YafY